MSETSNSPQGQKPKTPRVAIASLVFGILSLCTLEVSDQSAWRLFVEHELAVIALRASVLVGLVLGIVAIVKIGKSNGRLKNEITLNEWGKIMKCRTSKLLLLALAGLLSANCWGELRSNRGASPLDALPAWIKRVTHFGQRADWSHDGKRILFIEKTFGDVYEVEVATGAIRPMTHHYYHEGYTRALYLSNGDILLSGARKFDAENPKVSRDEKNAELWVLKKDLSGPPTPLGEKCREGPAVSRRRMSIAWTQQNAFWIADVVYEHGVPKLANKNKIMDRKELPFKAGIETQNFRPPDEKELIFSAYGYQGSEVAGLDIETGKVVNYSKAPNQYDEPEGIFPDGKYTTVECDKHNPRGIHYNDIYKLALDGSGRTERLTFFADYPGYKATNPVISDDGRYMAFQYAKRGDWAGVGRGILVLDLAIYETLKKSQGE